jgi:hypothetical protein
MTQFTLQPFIVVYIGNESPNLVRSETLRPKPYLPRNNFVQQYLHVCHLNCKINLIKGGQKLIQYIAYILTLFNIKIYVASKANDNSEFQESESQ